MMEQQSNISDNLAVPSINNYTIIILSAICITFLCATVLFITSFFVFCR